RHTPRHRCCRPPGFPPFPYTPLFRSRLIGRRLNLFDRQQQDLAGLLLGRVVLLVFGHGGLPLMSWQTAPWYAFSFSIPRGCDRLDRKSTRLNSSHVSISYAVFCLKKK